MSMVSDLSNQSLYDDFENIKNLDSILEQKKQ